MVEPPGPIYFGKIDVYNKGCITEFSSISTQIIKVSLKFVFSDYHVLEHFQHKARRKNFDCLNISDTRLQRVK